MIKVTCEYKSGGGSWIEEGEFVLEKVTTKRLTLRMIKKGFFAQYPDKKIRIIPTPKGQRTVFCPAIDYDGNEITIYHESRGLPFVYTFQTHLNKPLF